MIWIAFIAFVLLMLALDLGVFQRKAHVVTVKEALAWSAVWLSLGTAFAVFVYFAYDGQWLGLGSVADAVDGMQNDGSTATEKYLTGYVVEKSLSVDNIFVIAMIFSFFAVPPLYQHRVLFLGILGALLLRGAMIVLGARLIAEFHWVLYLFAIFYHYSTQMLLQTDTPIKQEFVVRLTRRFSVTGSGAPYSRGAPASYESEIPSDRSIEVVGRLNRVPPPYALALALNMVETTDVIFAVDSIPRSSPSRATPSWFSPATCSRSWVSGRSISLWPGW
jgi:tellurite resistance protein TerC